jgi:hypothetical protein
MKTLERATGKLVGWVGGKQKQVAKVWNGFSWQRPVAGVSEHDNHFWVPLPQKFP